MDEELKNLLKKDLEVSEKSLEILKKIHKDILWRRVLGLLKFGVIAAIFVWSYLQLQPFLENFLASYQKVFGAASGQTIDLNSLSPETKVLLENLFKQKKP